MDELLSLLNDDEFRPNHDELDPKQLDKSALKEIDLNFFGSFGTNSDTNLGDNVAEKSLIGTVCADLDSSDDENFRDSTVSKYNEYGKTIKNYLKSQEKSPYQNKSYDKVTWKKLPQNNSGPNLKSPEIKSMENKPLGKASHSDGFGGIAITNPVISSVEMKERLNGRRVIQMHNIRMNMKGGDIEGDWVTTGVVVKKCDPKTSSRGSMYSIWNLCNLKNCDDVISLFLFGQTHDQHWKIGLGSVIGILNPSIMPQNKKYKNNDLSITVDNPQKILYMGISKDFGICKGRRKDGMACTMFVNKSVCEFCNYHVTKAYYKTSSKRVELQSSFSSGEPIGLKQKLLQKQGIFYGGQYFSQARPTEKPKKTNTTSKPAGLLGSMNSQLQNKAKAMAENVTRDAAMSLEKNAEEITEKPMYSNGITVGSRNLLKHLGLCKDSQSPTGVKPPIKSISAKELLKMHANELAKTTIKNKESLTKSALELYPAPVLGKGFTPGSFIPLTNVNPINNRAKLRAVQKIKSCGPITKVNTNFVPKNRKSAEFQEKIKKRLAEDSENESAAPITKKSKLDHDSLEFQNLLNRKSNHDYLAQEHELNQQNNYFGFMEKKEQLETKMSSIMETSCKVVSCKQCKYTALSALDSCRKDGHNLVVSKAMKRFFMCKDCKNRTISFSKLPTKPCSRCGERNYERVAMHQERKGPKLDGEQLLVRGNEINSLNSAAYSNSSNINL